MVIRVGIIGLSAAATGTGWAASAHLPYLQKSPHYKIVALCNSSLENAKAAVKAYNLPPETKTYGSPEDLAQDEEVDLVVANTRVDLHGKVLLPSLKKGKAVFSEWPMDANENKAKAMLDAAKASGSKTIVGLQGRANPSVQKVKQIIDQGRIGKVYSSTFYGFATNGGDETTAKVSYLVQREVGGNILTIHFGHSLDTILYTIGDIESVQSLLASQIPETKIIDGSETKKVIGVVKKDTPDQILLQAKLKTGAVLSLHLQGGPPPPFDPVVLWRIHGEKGDIDIASSSLMLNVRTDGIKIRLHDRETGSVEDIQADKDEQDELPVAAKNTGRVYEAYAKNDKTFLVNFEEAHQRHVLIDKMLKRWDDKDQGWRV